MAKTSENSLSNTAPQEKPVMVPEGSLKIEEPKSSQLATNKNDTSDPSHAISEEKEQTNSISNSNDEVQKPSSDPKFKNIR